MLCANLHLVTPGGVHCCGAAQAVFDVLDIDREHGDRIRNIVVLGVNTFKWSFKVRGKPAPEPAPFLQLTAPSGVKWEFGDPASPSSVVGLASEFCEYKNALYIGDFADRI